MWIGVDKKLKIPIVNHLKKKLYYKNLNVDEGGRGVESANMDNNKIL